MSKQEPGMAYNMKTLNKVFAFLALLFLFAVIWMFLDDYIRPWKMVQIKGLEIEQEYLQSKIVSEEAAIDQIELKKLRENAELAKSNLEAKNSELKKLESEQAEVQRNIYVQNMTIGGVSATKGEVQFKLEHAIAHDEKNHIPHLQERFNKLTEQDLVERNKLKLLNEQEKSIKKKILFLTEDLTNSEKELADKTAAYERLVAAESRTQKTPVWFLRNAPFVDFMDPTLKIHQVVVPNVTDDRYFQQVPKVDRCTTCHLFIDKKGFEDRENPYKTHPRVDTLAVGLNSAHPVKDFGCTSCHGGEGHKVFDFSSPAHIPQNEEQKKEWVAKYGWHEPHKIASPMLPLQYTEASCVKCHNNVGRLPMADKMNEGKDLVEAYGCYSCHKIAGWEHLSKPAPSLLRIKGKTSKEFIKNWIWSPFTFNAHSKMPSFFGQSNNSSKEFSEKNIAEVNAMGEFLWNKSTAYTATHTYKGGDADKGKELIESVGCMSCHQVEGVDEKFNEAKSLKGPYLTGTGSKVNKDWLVSWLIKPSHYQDDTIMPSFRLSDTEANDIASYLLSLRNKTFESLEFAKFDKELRDQMLIDYLSAFDSLAVAKEKLAKMSDHERTMDLGARSIGKYGCYSCHNIEGYSPDRPGIGPELSAVGSKPVHQFGFGQQHDVGHSRHEWITAHLQNPRRWDIGLPKQFKDLNLMPHFYFDNNQIESMVTFLLGNVSDYIPLAGKKLLTPTETLTEKGKQIASKYNCQGCHKIDGVGGKLSTLMDSEEEGAPYLVKQGERVQADWFFSFLKNVVPIRPFVKLRMPSFNFSDDEVNALVNYFVADAGVSHFINIPSVKWEEGEREAALKLWDELACASCHAGGFSEDDWLAPDLHFAKKRLRPEWILKWLKNPQAILPYTSMANFWEGNVSAVEGVLGDSPERQRNALMKLILEFGKDKNAVPFAPGNTSVDMKFPQ